MKRVFYILIALVLLNSIITASIIKAQETVPILGIDAEKIVNITEQITDSSTRSDYLKNELAKIIGNNPIVKKLTSFLEFFNPIFSFFFGFPFSWTLIFFLTFLLYLLLSVFLYRLCGSLALFITFFSKLSKPIHFIMSFAVSLILTKILFFKLLAAFIIRKVQTLSNLPSQLIISALIFIFIITLMLLSKQIFALAENIFLKKEKEREKGETEKEIADLKEEVEGLKERQAETDSVFNEVGEAISDED